MIHGWDIGTLCDSHLTQLEPMGPLRWTVFPVHLCQHRVRAMALTENSRCHP